ncbi:hypothetical protein BDV38DRAFT_260681 [Aspergillus pseudotamarii]|uniref:Uncharacterized protein n=1 Tax=Aspergillus pseudotamarii TaxID=132259 RepID=A0A5N6SHR8_ASPPS|nr:uncharacterized protein BDV38DRAFT_260681 [Aspergillus pseudotamarii]KAE8132664.1 hypothetical protein BDV38DRAFT_260681 [Aspergillus pseudotamarii]
MTLTDRCWWSACLPALPPVTHFFRTVPRLTGRLMLGPGASICMSSLVACIIGL